MLETFKSIWPTLREAVELIVMISAVGLGAWALYRLPKFLDQLKETTDSLFARLNELDNRLHDLNQQDVSNKEWDAIKEDWGEIRDYIEKRIDDVEDGRARRRYEAMPRGNYNKLIEALEKDGVLKTDVASMMVYLNTEFQKLRRHPKEIPPETVQYFEKCRRFILGLREKS